MATPETPGQPRIVVAVDASAASRLVLELAADLAVTLHTSLAGLYVEEEDLLHAAGLPFAREVRARSGQVGPFTVPDLERHWRALANEARSALTHAAQARQIAWSFEVVRGRVAQVMSDHGWLWSRGLEGGGPQAEVMRRTAHWLMKEPALEEESLQAEVEGATLKVTRRSLAKDHPPVTITGPDGVEHRLELTAGRDGIDFGRIDLNVAGLYRIGDGTRSTIAVLGNLNPVEFSDLVSTDRHLRPFVEATNGGIIRLSRYAEPDIRRVDPGRQGAGSDWVGLLRNGAFDVTGLKTTPLAPPLAVLLTLLLLLLVCWRREGQ